MGLGQYKVRCAVVAVLTLVLLYFSVPICVGLEGVVFTSILPLAVSTYTGRWHVPTATLYLIVIVFVTLREVLVILSGVVPCGLCHYESHCAAHLSDVECFQWKVQERRCWSTTEEMDWTLLWVAVPPTLGSIPLAVLQMWKFHQSNLQDWLQAPVMVILMIPTTYGFCALYSLRLLTQNHSDLWTPRAIFDVCELYVALGLFAFKHLMILCARVTAESRRREEAHFWELWELGSGLMELGCGPYVLWCFFGNFAEIVAKEFVDWFRPGLCLDVLPTLVRCFFPSLVDPRIEPEQTFVAFKSHGKNSYVCQEAWGALLPSMTAMNLMVCSIAIACIILYEQAVGSYLHSLKPTVKFMGVKGLLLVSFWQTIILNVLAAYGCDDWCQARFNSFLLCWEALGLGVYHIYSYDPADFTDVALLPSTPCEPNSGKGKPPPTEEVQEPRHPPPSMVVAPAKDRAEHPAEGSASALMGDGSGCRWQELPPPVEPWESAQTLDVHDGIGFMDGHYTWMDDDAPHADRACCGVM